MQPVHLLHRCPASEMFSYCQKCVCVCVRVGRDFKIYRELKEKKENEILLTPIRHISICLIQRTTEYDSVCYAK